MFFLFCSFVKVFFHKEFNCQILEFVALNDEYEKNVLIVWKCWIEASHWREVKSTRAAQIWYSAGYWLKCGDDEFWFLFSVEFPVSLSTSWIYRRTRRFLQFSLLFWWRERICPSAERQTGGFLQRGAQEDLRRR